MVGLCLDVVVSRREEVAEFIAFIMSLTVVEDLNVLIERLDTLVGRL